MELLSMTEKKAEWERPEVGWSEITVRFWGSSSESMIYIDAVLL